MEYYRIRELREDNDLSQREVAAKLNIAQRTYSGYESGSRNIPVQILAALAKLYGTTTDYLLNLTNEK